MGRRPGREAAARPLEKQEAGLISKPLKVGYHSVV